MNNPKIHQIKRNQKESLLFKAISELYLSASLEDPNLAGLFITRAVLSPDKGNCTIYFYSTDGKQAFDEKLNILKLYKPSMRKGISNVIRGKYVPELRFAFDEQFEKQQRIEELIEKVKREDKL